MHPCSLVQGDDIDNDSDLDHDSDNDDDNDDDSDNDGDHDVEHNGCMLHFHMIGAIVLMSILST